MQAIYCAYHLATRRPQNSKEHSKLMSIGNPSQLCSGVPATSAWSSLVQAAPSQGEVPAHWLPWAWVSRINCKAVLKVYLKLKQSFRRVTAICRRVPAAFLLVQKNCCFTARCSHLESANTRDGAGTRLIGALQQPGRCDGRYLAPQLLLRHAMRLLRHASLP